MAKSLDVISKNLQIFVEQNSPRVFGGEYVTVQEVDLTNFTFEGTGQATEKYYQAVPFTTVPGEMESIICVPEIDSTVLVMETDRVNNYAVATGKLAHIICNAPIMTINYVDNFIVTDNEDFVFQFTPDLGMELDMSDVEFKVNNDGMKLTVGSADFKTGLSDLKTALEQLTVNTPNGPSSIPINISAITAAMQKILDCLQ